MEAELAYYSEEPEDIEGLFRSVARMRADRPGEGEQIAIPVRAMLPGASRPDQTADFGTTSLGSRRA